MVMETTPPSFPHPKTVGREFVRQYYTVLNKYPELVHRFYNSDSSFVHSSIDKPGRPEAKHATGQQEINEKILQLNFHNCHARIKQVDSQATLGNSVVVQVSGEFSNNGEPMKKFVQTFILVPETPKKYYVRNDIFRYQDQSDDERDNEDSNQGNQYDSQDELDSDIKNNTNSSTVVNNVINAREEQNGTAGTLLNVGSQQPHSIILSPLTPSSVATTPAQHPTPAAVQQTPDHTAVPPIVSSAHEVGTQLKPTQTGMFYDNQTNIYQQPPAQLAGQKTAASPIEEALTSLSQGRLFNNKLVVNSVDKQPLTAASTAAIVDVSGSRAVKIVDTPVHHAPLQQLQEITKKVADVTLGQETELPPPEQVSHDDIAKVKSSGETGATTEDEDEFVDAGGSINSNDDGNAGDDLDQNIRSDSIAEKATSESDNPVEAVQSTAAPVPSGPPTYATLVKSGPGFNNPVTSAASGGLQQMLPSGGNAGNSVASTTMSGVTGASPPQMSGSLGQTGAGGRHFNSGGMDYGSNMTNQSQAGYAPNNTRNIRGGGGGGVGGGRGGTYQPSNTMNHQNSSLSNSSRGGGMMGGQVMRDRGGSAMSNSGGRGGGGSGYGGGFDDNNQNDSYEERRRSFAPPGMNYPDSQQIFVGNLPHHLTEERLKEICSNYGEVLHVKINSKPNMKGGPGMGGTVGGNRVPNYGFVIFKDSESVQSMLSKKPITYRDGSEEFRLNVEEKKTNRLKSDMGMQNRVPPTIPNSHNSSLNNSDNMGSGGGGPPGGSRFKMPNHASAYNSGGMSRGVSSTGRGGCGTPFRDSRGGGRGGYVGPPSNRR